MLINVIYSIPNFALISVIVAAVTTIALVSLFIAQRFTTHEKREKNSGPLSSLSGDISVIYSFIVGLIIAAVYTDFNKVDDLVKNEAEILSSIHRNTLILSEPLRQEIQSLTKNYIKGIVNEDWPVMQRGASIADSNKYLDALSVKLVQYRTDDSAQGRIIDKITKAVDELYAARQKRENASAMTVHQDIWVLVIIGTALAIGTKLFYNMDIVPYICTLTCVSIMMSCLIFLILAFDKPFRGKISIQPDDFNGLLKRMETQAAP